MKKSEAKKAAEAENRAKMPLQAVNYYLLLAAAAIIIIGFLLMSGGKSASPEVFNYDMFSFRRITLAPILVIGGFVLAGYAIMKRPKK